MTLVVADSGPISYLTLIDAIHVLPALFEKVILPRSIPSRRNMLTCHRRKSASRW